MEICNGWGYGWSMAKLFKSKPEAEVEVGVTFMRRIAGTDRFEVVTGTVTGPVKDEKILERGVSFVVGRASAEKSFEKQKQSELLKLRDLPRA